LLLLLLRLLGVLCLLHLQLHLPLLLAAVCSPK
jgi:hypothetical protein